LIPSLLLALLTLQESQDLPPIDITDGPDSVDVPTPHTNELLEPILTSIPIPVQHIQSLHVRRPLVKLKDSYTYSIEPSTIEQLFPPSIDYIKLIEPIETSCLFGIIEEPSELLTFTKVDVHLRWKATMKSESIRGDLRPPEDCEFPNCENSMGTL